MTCVLAATGAVGRKWTHLLGTALQHFLIVLAVCSAQVSSQALRWLIGQLDTILQQTDGQSPLQQWGWLS